MTVQITTGVYDTCSKLANGVKDTSRNSPIIRTFVIAVNNTSGKFATSVNDTGSKFKLNIKQFFYVNPMAPSVSKLNIKSSLDCDASVLDTGGATFYFIYFFGGDMPLFLRLFSFIQYITHGWITSHNI